MLNLWGKTWRPWPASGVIHEPQSVMSDLQARCPLDWSILSMIEMAAARPVSGVIHEPQRVMSDLQARCPLDWSILSMIEMAAARPVSGVIHEPQIVMSDLQARCPLDWSILSMIEMAAARPVSGVIHEPQRVMSDLQARCHCLLDRYHLTCKIGNDNPMTTYFWMQKYALCVRTNIVSNETLHLWTPSFYRHQIEQCVFLMETVGVSKAKHSQFWDNSYLYKISGFAWWGTDIVSVCGNTISTISTIAKWGTGFWKEPYRATRISTVAKWDYSSEKNQHRATRFSTIAKGERGSGRTMVTSQGLLYILISML